MRRLRREPESAIVRSETMNDIIIRAFAGGDEYAVAEVVKETLRISNSRDYPKEYIEDSIQSHSAEAIREQAKEAHFYVACDGDRVIGCGGITGYWGSTEESYLPRSLCCRSIRAKAWAGS